MKLYKCRQNIHVTATKNMPYIGNVMTCVYILSFGASPEASSTHPLNATVGLWKALHLQTCYSRQSSHRGKCCRRVQERPVDYKQSGTDRSGRHRRHQVPMGDVLDYPIDEHSTYHAAHEVATISNRNPAAAGQPLPTGISQRATYS